MIYGIGCDTVDTAGFAARLERTPGLKARLFTPAERGLKPLQLAARFAAKEALIKALGGSEIVGATGVAGAVGNTGVVVQLSWQDLEVLPAAGLRPVFSATAQLTAALTALGIDRLHLSLSHDTGQAVAFVVAEMS